MAGGAGGRAARGAAAAAAAAQPTQAQAQTFLQGQERTAARNAMEAHLAASGAPFLPEDMEEHLSLHRIEVTELEKNEAELAQIFDDSVGAWREAATPARRHNLATKMGGQPVDEARKAALSFIKAETRIPAGRESSVTAAVSAGEAWSSASYAKHKAGLWSFLASCWQKTVNKAGGGVTSKTGCEPSSAS